MPRLGTLHQQAAQKGRTDHKRHPAVQSPRCPHRLKSGERAPGSTDSQQSSPSGEVKRETREPSVRAMPQIYHFSSKEFLTS
mmetsp:Transcript_44295/g.87437  ORF Transcript_44295/g.87437 Transcript_44295/m.87437 type:complete len:82 (-) Transcript_44295:161-406(-)